MDKNPAPLRMPQMLVWPHYQNRGGGIPSGAELLSINRISMEFCLILDVIVFWIGNIKIFWMANWMETCWILATDLS